ncbi:Uncharacterised protein [BD1-7 clade bacterium]|uniref:Inovirus Gp2 family protein n=1 Tax=BD1-7 clade bacterium TaxID=2029982 RepID=A0A5S9PCU3_9GAMM|nr:Uncharacterised protein [BD1-7 clade bacterium]CAA0101559.1 Uncharacterised protein [BD1-7 clade bacterium]
MPIQLTTIEKRNKQLRHSIEEFIHQQNGALFITMTFIEGTSDIDCRTAANELIKSTNRKLFGPRFKQRDQCIEGFVIQERCLNNTLHFHMLFNYSDKCLTHQNIQSIDITMRQRLPRLVALSTKSKQPICKGSGFCVKPYFQRCLAAYLLKHIRRCRHHVLDTNNIGILGREGILFGEPVWANYT